MRCRLPLAVVALVAAALGAPLAAAAPDGGADVVIAAGEPVSSFPLGIAFPVEVSSDEPVTEVHLLYRAALAETLNEAPVAIEPGSAVSAGYDLDLRDGSLPPGVEIRYRWRVTEADGDIAESPERGITWLDSRFAWTEIASPRVTVNAYNGDPAFNQAVLETAEATIDRLSAEFGAQLSEPVRIWVYNSREDFGGSLAPNSEPWVVGAAYPALGLINAVLPPGNTREMARVIPHEISHQVLHQATRNPFNQPPDWLEEGLASRAQLAGHEMLWRSVEAAALAGNLDSLRILNGEFPYDSSGALLAYGESMSAVSYIIDTYGEDAMSDLIAVLREGVTYDEAVERTLGIPLDQLSDDWQAQALEQARRELAELGPPAGGFTGDGPFAGLLASGALVVAAVVAVALTGSMLARRRRAGEDEDGDGEGFLAAPGMDLDPDPDAFPDPPTIRLPGSPNGARP